MDWVHCNNCFFFPGMGKRFYLTSCGHIYCVDCIRECAADHCKLCGNTCSSIPLSSQMKPDVEMYFSDPLELLKKYLKQIQKVAEFQSSHRTRLFAYQREMAKKSQLLKDEFKKCQLKYKECESDRQKLNSQVECLKQMLSMNQFGSSGMPALSKSEGCHKTPPYLPQGDVLQNNTPLSKWSQGSSHSRNRSGGSTASQYPAMPARVVLRTPPVNGKLGIIPVNPLNSAISIPSFRLAGQSSTDATPKVGKDMFVRGSPMSVSPCSSVTSVMSHDLPPAAPHCSSSPFFNSQSCHSGNNNSVTGSHGTTIRQIKLPYDMKNYRSIKTLAVTPYSPETPDQSKK